MDLLDATLAFTTAPYTFPGNDRCLLDDESHGTMRIGSRHKEECHRYGGGGMLRQLSGLMYGTRVRIFKHGERITLLDLKQLCTARRPRLQLAASDCIIKCPRFIATRPRPVSKTTLSTTALLVFEMKRAPGKRSGARWDHRGFVLPRHHAGYWWTNDEWKRLFFLQVWTAMIRSMLVHQWTIRIDYRSVSRYSITLLSVLSSYENGKRKIRSQLHPTGKNVRRIVDWNEWSRALAPVPVGTGGYVPPLFPHLLLLTFVCTPNKFFRRLAPDLCPPTSELLPTPLISRSLKKTVPSLDWILAMYGLGLGTTRARYFYVELNFVRVWLWQRTRAEFDFIPSVHHSKTIDLWRITRQLFKISK